MLYYHCNGGVGDMLHSTHGIDGRRNVVVYACPHSNRMVCENGVTLLRVRATTMVISLYIDEFTLLYNGMKGIGFINANAISGP